MTPEQVEQIRLRAAVEARKREIKTEAARQKAIEQGRMEQARRDYETLSLRELWAMYQAGSGYPSIVIDVLRPKLAAFVTESDVSRIIRLAETIPFLLWKGVVSESFEKRMWLLLNNLDAEAIESLAERADAGWATPPVKKILASRLLEVARRATAHEIQAKADRASGRWARETYAKALHDAHSQELSAYEYGKLVALLGETPAEYPSELVLEHVVKRAPGYIGSADFEGLYKLWIVLEANGVSDQFGGTIGKRLSTLIAHAHLDVVREWYERRESPRFNEEVRTSFLKARGREKATCRWPVA